MARCVRRVTMMVREVDWWDYYLVCGKHVAWARTQFPKGMKLVEKAYPDGYPEIVSPCVHGLDGRSSRTRRSERIT